MPKLQRHHGTPLLICGLAPTAWSDLDAFYLQPDAVDPHFELALTFPRAGDAPLELYAIQFVT